MSRAPAALAFLIARTTRNRVATQLARLRNPRYAIAMVLGVAYFWFVFGRPTGSSPSFNPRAAGALGALGGLGLAVTVMWWWLFGGVSGALAFQPAEVHFLFPAPVSRPMLVAYKVARSQLLLLLNAILWVLLMRQWALAISLPQRYLTAWAFFSLLSLHRLGAALVQLQPAGGARRAARLLGRAAAAAAALALASSLAPAARVAASQGWAEALRAAGDALATAPASYVMAPFRLVVRPLASAGDAAWLTAFLPVLGLIAVHLGWVIAMRVPFEEAAATASADIARRVAAFKARRAGGSAPAAVTPGTRVRDWLPLAPTGFPAMAIVWKNTLALFRTGFTRVLVILLVFVMILSRMIAADGGGGPAATAPFLMVAFLVFVIGPRLVRTDLRQDLLSASLLKTYPLRGWSLITAELTTPVAALTLLQAAALTGAWLVAPAAWHERASPAATAALAPLLAAGLLALNAAAVGIQNGAALLLPGWVRLGTDSGGVEAMGQMMMVTIGALLALLVALIPPAVAGAAALYLSRPALGAMAAVPAVAAAVVVLSVEVVALIAALGGVFDRMEGTAAG